MSVDCNMWNLHSCRHFVGAVFFDLHSRKDAHATRSSELLLPKREKESKYPKGGPAIWLREAIYGGGSSASMDCFVEEFTI